MQESRWERRLPTYARRREIKLGYVLAVVAIHLAALAAPWYVTRAGVWAFVTLYVLTGQVGINLGFHRLLSHRSYRLPGWLESTFAVLGTLAVQGGPIGWVGNHRFHHKEADRDLDPHTPLAGIGWAHFGWTFFRHPILTGPDERERFARDLAKLPALAFCERHAFGLNALSWAGLYGAGYLTGGPPLGTSMLVWGGALRIVAIWHMTFVVNSINHLWGYRTYDTADNSRNNAWVSLLVLGEGWHNNHHAEPRSAAHGHRPLEFDPAYRFVCILESVGLATRVIRPRSWTTSPAVDPSP